MSRRTAILDASSAIILSKAGLHELLADVYEVIMPQSVYREITVHSYAGSIEYARLAEAKRVVLHGNLHGNDHPGLRGFGRGERDTIRLYHAGIGDFIITDDGPAARHCRRTGILFINGLLFPVILRMGGLRDKESCLRAMDAIMAAGRYSEEVVAFALNCRREDIPFAMP